MALIKEHSLSIGYNNSGQSFFDTLFMFSPYIHSYYLSLSKSIGGSNFNKDMVLKRLKNINTYNFKGNLIFNYPPFDDWEEDFKSVNNCVEINSITVLIPELARIIKNKYPNMEIHLSTRYFDWLKIKENNVDINNLKDSIDVINVSAAFQGNHFEFMKYLKNEGFKLKFIVNEGCLPYKDEMYRNFPGFENCRCRIPTPCGSHCIKIVEKYPWMMLARSAIHKESLKYYPFIDIWKISSRNRYTYDIYRYLEYWTSDKPTKYLSNTNIKLEGEKYNLFLEYLEDLSKCSYDCYKCKKCKKYFELFTKDMSINNIQITDGVRRLQQDDLLIK